MTNITSIEIDEIQYRRGHTYLTLVYQLDDGVKRLLYVARDRTEASLNGFFNILSESTINGIASRSVTDRTDAEAGRDTDET